MLSKYLYGMNLWVMSRNESAESMASAPKTSGLREATFQAPKPPDENPNTPRLRAVGDRPIGGVDSRDDVVQHVLLEVAGHG